mmetsp:Transcript_9145/g.13355  ORF Transcript_9145/g.13355 Transcript_9145/m.13355 type:complete len:250 (-) Transcript_9145:472-1221(-)
MGVPLIMREQVKRLMNNRDAVEAEIEALTSSLTADGMPGISGPLVDREGYPLADVNVHQVREWRQKLIQLHNDHKAITDQIERALHQTIPADPSATANVGPPRDSGSTSFSDSTTASYASTTSTTRVSLIPTSQPMLMTPEISTSNTERTEEANGSIPSLPPFATVDVVAPNSVAAAGGLRQGDLIMSFGGIRKERFSETAAAVRAMAGAVRDHNGVPLNVTVMRNGVPLALSLSPAIGSPLGCRVLPT